MRVLACVLAVLACSSSAAAHEAACPRVPGSISYVRGTETHVVSLASCADRVAGAAPAQTRSVAGVHTTGPREGTQRIWVRGRLVFAHRENGPVIPLKLSDDGRWLFFVVDPFASGSMAADGLDLLVVSTHGGALHHLGVTLPYPDYLAWCGGELVYTPGADRVALHAKRLMAAAPPDWRPRPLWDDRARSFASPACEPGGRAVAVLTQRSSTNARFFATRWRMWRVGLDGSRRELDVPPEGWADEQPEWSADGRSLLFVRERNGYGRVMLRRDGTVFGPLADLGYSLGYYGHHAWRVAWR